jgi:hypothetical protein
MEKGILILVELKPTMTHVAIVPSLGTTRVDPGVDVKVEEIKAANMEEYCRKCNYEDVIPIRKGDDVEGRFLPKPFYLNQIFTRCLLKLK